MKTWEYEIKTLRRRQDMMDEGRKKRLGKEKGVACNIRYSYC